MNRYIGDEIEKRFAEHKVANPDTSKQPSSKAIVSLLIDDLHREAGSKDLDHIKQDVKTATTSQLRVFLFAGHDTSSSALTYCYYLLSTHPEALTRLLAEHDAVFGREPAEALGAIHKDPNKINQVSSLSC